MELIEAESRMAVFRGWGANGEMMKDTKPQLDKETTFDFFF